MSTDVSRPPFLGACLFAILAQIMVVVGLATPAWTVSRGVTIGLWGLTDQSGFTYSWVDTGAYNGDFFYSSWFSAVRALMMAGVILGGMGIIFNVFIIVRKKYSLNYGKALCIYYFLAFALVVIAAAVYSCEIPQGIDANGAITKTRENIVRYIYLGGYGYSIWFTWIGSGVFLLAGGVAFEGSNQQRVNMRLHGKGK